MKVIDLFAGAGGLSEGFRREGYDIIAHVEMDKSASLTLKTREAFYYLKEENQLNIYKLYLKKEISREDLYSYIPSSILSRVINKEINYSNLNDIFKSVDADEIDLIIGGPPCQAYSVAGRSRDSNRMKNDPRNYLYLLYIEFLKKYKPKIFVFENVLGLLSAREGRIFQDIKNQINNIGYKLDYEVLDSSDFGVLQKRKRVILIGWRADIDFEYPSFKINKSNNTINELFKDLPKIKSGTQMEIGQYSKDFNLLLENAKIKDVHWDVLTQHTARTNNDKDLSIYKIVVNAWNNGKRRIRYNELPKNLINHRNTKSFLDRFKVIDGQGISHTIVAHISKDGHYYIHPDIEQNRSITVREAARIQSFPDDYYFETCRTDAFKQIGNAVPPLMAEKIAQRILLSLKPCDFK